MINIKSNSIKYINSYGIICFNVHNLIDISIEEIIKYISSNNQILDKINNNQLNTLENKQLNTLENNQLNNFKNNQLNNFENKIDNYDKIKILMIRRRHSLNYVQFIRGKYTLFNLNKIFKLMTKSENILIKNNNFEYLWNELWCDTAKNKNYKKEYLNSKNKFNKLKENNFYNLLEENNMSDYLEPEWEFPKGKRNNKETSLLCAMREFKEETNININNINIFKNIECIDEKYKGTDNKYYKHSYYMAISNNNFKLNTIEHISEVGDINWFNINDALNKIRNYNINKLELINNIYYFINKIICEIYKDNKNI